MVPPRTRYLHHHALLPAHDAYARFYTLNADRARARTRTRARARAAHFTHTCAGAYHAHAFAADRSAPYARCSALPRRDDLPRFSRLSPVGTTGVWLFFNISAPPGSLYCATGFMACLACAHALRDGFSHALPHTTPAFCVFCARYVARAI